MYISFHNVSLKEHKCPKKGGNAHRALPVDKLLLLQGLYCLRDLLAVYLPAALYNLIGASKGTSI